MLLGQGLGRRHQRRLVAGFERPQHRVDGDHGLARADLAHQQPLHRLARVEVGVDRRRRRPAGRRSARRAASRASARPVSPALPKPRRRPRRALGALARSEQRLVEEQLFEGEPLARASASLLGAAGKWAARIASPTPASRRRARSSAGSPSIAFGAQPAGLLGPVADPLRPQRPRSPDGPGRSLRAAGPVRRRALRAGRSVRPRLSSSAPAAVELPLVDPEAAFGRACRSAAAGRPGSSLSATQGWLNQVARTWPLSSPTLTPTIVSRPLRNGRGLDAEDLDQDRRLLPCLDIAEQPHLRGRGGGAGSGRRRSPTVRDARLPPPPRPSFGPTPSRACERDVEHARAAASGRGRRSSVGAARARRPPAKRSAQLLGREQPPPARLAPLVGLDLDPVGHVGVDLVERDRGAVAADHGDDLGPLGEVLDRRRVRVEPAPPQATISPPAKPTASPCLKRPWASSRAAGATPPVATPSRAASSRSAFSSAEAVRVELDQRQQARLLRGRRRPPGPASRRARRRARRPSPRSRSSAAPGPPRRRPRGSRPAARRSRG